MPRGVLQPFPSPAETFSRLSIPGGAAMLMEWFLYAVFAFWVVYSLVAVYHWLKYSHASFVAFPAIAAHVLVSIALMTYALSGTLPL